MQQDNTDSSSIEIGLNLGEHTMNKQLVNFTKTQQKIIYYYALGNFFSNIDTIDNTMALWKELQCKNIEHPRDWMSNITLQHGEVLEKYLNMYIGELYELIVGYIDYLIAFHHEIITTSKTE